jgi:hypothetical protein
MEKLYFLKVGNYYYRGSYFLKWTKNWRKAAVLPHYEWAYLVKNDYELTFYEILSLEEVVDGACTDYRALSSNDIIRAGDELQHLDGTWHTILMFIGQNVGPYERFRRKITLDS